MAITVIIAAAAAAAAAADAAAAAGIPVRSLLPVAFTYYHHSHCLLIPSYLPCTTCYLQLTTYCLLCVLSSSQFFTFISVIVIDP